MHPPPFVCRRLYELDPQIRLAWLGYRPRYEGELNAGTFCIIQLWDKDHFGSHERPNVPAELWNARPLVKNGDVEMVRCERGPVFNRTGGVRPDWDPLAKDLVYRMNLKDFGISTEDVVSGAILHQLERFYRPLKDRIAEDEEDAARHLKRRAEDNGREAGHRLHRALNRHDVSYKVVPYEDQRKELLQREALRQSRDVTELVK